MQVLLNTDAHIEGSAEVTRQVEALVEGALDRFRDRITRVEVHLADENSSEKFAGNDKRCVMEVRLAGIPPIAVSHRGSSLEQALNGAADTLEKTLKRTLGRKDSLYKRRARARAEFTAVEPRLQQDAASGDQEDFLALLRPLLGHLRDHARRELRILESNDLLSPGQVTDNDLLDEVMARAWLRAGDRPRLMSLELWLVGLLDERLNEMIQPEPRKKKSLEQPAGETPAEDVPQVDDQEWWLWLMGDVEGSTLAEAIPSGESASAVQQLEAEELKDRVHTVLGELPTAQHQAFVLNVLEGYELFEIAMLQDRPETEVQADIEAARNALRAQLPAGARPQASPGPAAAAGAVADATQKS